jgi:broad specificity phosphatase PhoE
MTEHTVVHLLRHGEVDNPGKILYGRLPGYHLSELGRRMADRVRDVLASRDITRIVSSPMERAQETAAPLAAKLGLDVVIDQRLIEAANRFQGQPFGVGDGVLRKPSAWRHLYNPFLPSWGEPYAQLAFRMHAAIENARVEAAGHETVLVSHQLPIWVARLGAEHRRLWHDPRKRDCSLASLTALHYDGVQLVSIDYSQPCADLLPGASPVAGA